MTTDAVVRAGDALAGPWVRQISGMEEATAGLSEAHGGAANVAVILEPMKQDRIMSASAAAA